ncbi:YggS family pyridoxal phosphate-dependent enzyme [Corynebacterium breve]|uniref:Pyridoxal phosphate homeostasis protein n=1 Tax=Corynebacterium breve TaxID=3049799 RepID=A0ABY8VEB3_9CORY|nr:YggS family pyridoxal phosphate-dependent enzyme [Corynebacterium breve]WIM66968.1 YggS family pyridoxal phosphate-dependent enzyme [Corynebacterium breve]
MTRFEDISANLNSVMETIRAAEKAAGRTAGSVKLLPVTKFHPVEDIEILGQLGVDLVGENREQEARAKAEELKARGESSISIAMIGQIQTKKANAVARWAHEVHSLDTVRLAEGLNRGVGLAIERGDREAGQLPSLIQVSMDNDPTRGGVPLDDVDELAALVEETEHLRFDGIMVVPPLDTDPVEVFAQARELADRFGESLGRSMKLSAGMSGDFEKAIAEGSDIVRVGTGVLGARHVG